MKLNLYNTCLHISMGISKFLKFLATLFALPSTFIFHIASFIEFMELLMGADGFTLVTNKKKKKCKNLNYHRKTHVDAVCSNFSKSRLNKIQDELKLSEFFINFTDKLNHVQETKNLQDVTKNTNNDELSDLTLKMESVCTKSSETFNLICYGLGRFTSCLIARYQLAFLVILKDILKPDNLYIYDPVFSKEEISILSDFKMNIIEINEEAKRVVDCKTIFFMPHCDLHLYNNLLWANWNKRSLSKLIIIGNSLQDYRLYMPSAKLLEKATYVYLANDFMSEVKIANQFKYFDIFNDLSIHYFKSDELSNVSDHIWSETEEPVSDVCITKNE